MVECAILNLSAYQEYARRLPDAATGESPLASAMRAKLPSLSERAVESALGLLPSSLFVELLGSLLRSDSDSVRRRALEVFNAKLQGRDEDAKAMLDLARGGSDVVRGLLEPLAGSALGSVGKETELNQQLSIVALRYYLTLYQRYVVLITFFCINSLSPSRSFGKAIGSEFPGEFKEVCSKLTSKKFMKELKSNTVIASVLFCLPELFQVCLS